MMSSIRTRLNQLHQRATAGRRGTQVIMVIRCGGDRSPQAIFQRMLKYVRGPVTEERKAEMLANIEDMVRRQEREQERWSGVQDQ